MTVKGFGHLHVHTEYSTLDGMSKIKELVTCLLTPKQSTYLWKDKLDMGYNNNLALKFSMIH